MTKQTIRDTKEVRKKKRSRHEQTEKMQQSLEKV